MRIERTLPRIILSCGLSAMALAITATPASAQGVTIRGARTCQAYLDAKDKSVQDALKDLTWFLGYMSGLAVATHVDVLGAGDTAESVIAWVDTFCQRYPAKRLSDAGDLYYKFIIEQMKANPQRRVEANEDESALISDGRSSPSSNPLRASGLLDGVNRSGRHGAHRTEAIFLK